MAYFQSEIGGTISTKLSIEFNIKRNNKELTVNKGNSMSRRCHEVDYEIIGHSMQLVEVELDPNETVIAEAGR